MDLAIRTADESTIRLLDGLVGFWLALWLIVGTWAGLTAWHLSDLGDTVTRSGNAITSAGRALEDFSSVPVLGDTPGQVGTAVASAGQDIADRGQQVRSQLRRLSLLLGLAIAVMPTTPVLGLYLPLRNGRRREVSEVRRALRTYGDEAAFDRYLAERAVRLLPFDALKQLGGDPWQALAEGRYRALADAELQRLGLRRP